MILAVLVILKTSVHLSKKNSRTAKKGKNYQHDIEYEFVCR